MPLNRIINKPSDMTVMYSESIPVINENMPVKYAAEHLKMMTVICLIMSDGIAVALWKSARCAEKGGG